MKLTIQRLMIPLLLLSFLLSSCGQAKGDKFTVDNGVFAINGEAIQLICGEMHYPRIPKEYWRDRMQRARAMGLNTISTYVFWNFHELQPGQFDFEGQADLSEFVKIAAEEGLYVILRPGPYVCAEWDFGGYPYWLLNEKDMQYRTRNPKFLAACDRYISRLGEELKDQTIANGGNILMVQVENEYGSFGDDKVYLNSLKEMIEKAGFNVPLMTCDGGGQMEAGYLEGTLPTINGVFGEDLFPIIDKYQEGGPYFVAEFYPAWFDVWGEPHSTVDYKRPTQQLEWMLENNVSISMYMFHGGTNFWYTNGANTANGYAPQPTSYDYDAPLGEWGNAYPKYYAFREAIQKNLAAGETLPDVPADNPVTSFPKITLTESVPLSSLFRNSVESKEILTMEDLKQDFGYIHYETTIETKGKQRLSIHDLRDYAVILINGEQVGRLDRRYNQSSLDVELTTTPAKLEILVENTGRVNYGQDIQHNRKGITEKVVLGDKELKNWIITPLPLYKEDVSKLSFGESIKGVPALHRGTFNIDTIGDTFVDLSDWTKGAVWVNGKSIGKYWNIGPQQTLYLPAPWLKGGENEIVVFEMDDDGNRDIQGLSQPLLDVLGEDKSYEKRESREITKHPIIEKGDKLLTTHLETINEWQEFDFPFTTTMRHCCLEIGSTYENDSHSCILEIDLIDHEDQIIDKTKWSIVYATSEWTENNIGVSENLIDGDISSFWHTSKDDIKDYPHQITIDMGEIYSVKGIRIKTRDGAFLSGQVKDLSIYGRPQFFLFK